MSDFDFKIFDDKKYQDLLKDIYVSSKSREQKIDDLINSIQPLIKNIDDAMGIIPILSSYLETGVKNNEVLVHLATVIQRMQETENKLKKDLNSAKSGALEITNEEKEELRKKAEREISGLKGKSKELEEELNNIKYDNDELLEGNDAI